MENHPNYFSVKSEISWDEYFMLQAMVASFKSKDPSTKVGAVFVDSKNHQITMGYNGFIAGLDEKKLPWGNNTSYPLSEQKYAYVVHAEANAILHSPSELEGSRLYVTLFPCHDCAKLIASKKIKEVIYLQDKYAETESVKISKEILKMAGIRYKQIEISLEIKNKIAEHFLNL